LFHYEHINVAQLLTTFGMNQPVPTRHRCHRQTSREVTVLLSVFVDILVYYQYMWNLID